MNSENMTTGEWAELVAESLTNGQRKQAREQFRRALADYCEPFSLLADIAAICGESAALALAAAIIADD